METTGDLGLGSGELDYQGSSSQVVNMARRIDEHQVWNGGSILEGAPQIRRYGGESSQMAELQGMQRVKRQNCGNNVWGTMHGGSQDHIVTFGHCPLPGFSGFQSTAYQGSTGAPMTSYWNPNSSIFYSSDIGEHSGGSDYGRVVDPRYNPSNGKNHLDAPMPIQASLLPSAMRTSLDNFSDMNLHSNIDRRSSCKRKSPMEGSMGSTWPSDFRYNNPQGCLEIDFGGSSEVSAGSTRCDTTNALLPLDPGSSMVPMWNAPLYPRDARTALSSLRSSSPVRGFGRHHELVEEGAQPHSQSLTGCKNRIGGATMLPQASMSRRLLCGERMAESTGNMSLGSNISARNWCGSNAYTGNHAEQASLFHTPREFLSPGMFMGENNTLTRVNGASSWLCGAPNPTMFESTGRPFCGNTNRSVNVRDSRSQVPSHMGINRSYGHLPSLSSSRRSDCNSYSPAMPAASSNMMPSGPRTAAYGDIYPAVNRPLVPSPLLHGGGEASSMQNIIRTPFRGLQIFTGGGGTRQRLPSHDYLDQSLIYNGLDIHDRHSDMRLDVDNMTYEELLALEDRIGNVNTGLSDDDITKCLTVTQHSLLDVTKATLSQDSDVKCTICQEEYMEDDEIGKLNCGHNYHTTCIRQWLVLKNQCPICKAAAYSEP